jgi:hypothetical protein
LCIYTTTTAAGIATSGLIHFKVIPLRMLL